MKIAIAGAGAAGLLAALLLARAGHEVVVVEQDRFDASLDIESAAAAAFRPTAPQVVQPHAIMAGCRELMRDRLPDVYASLLAAGAVEAPLSGLMPSSLSDRSARPGDERLTALLSRRSTLDWVLLRAALDEPGVELRCGVQVRGLTAVPGKPPHVTGLRTNAGEIAADVTVDAAGRGSLLGRWLAQIGAQGPMTRQAECGLAYFSRHYRLRPAAALPGPATARFVTGLDEFTAVLFAADNATMQLGVVPLAADRRFRAARQPEVFTAVLRTISSYAAWLEVLDPVGPVHPMAGLRNTLRRLVVDGAPVITGLHAIGDSVCTTNPTLGRGLSLALRGAADLTDVVGKHPGDCAAQALALDALTADHVAPYYEDQAAIDSERLAMLRHAVFGVPAPSPAPLNLARVSYGELRAAAAVHPDAFRAFWQVQGMIRPPEQVYADPGVIASARAALEGLRSPLSINQPTRAQLLAALNG